MYKMKKAIRKITIFSIIATFFVSCEDYIDVNKDPNSPEVSELTPDNILPGAQTTTATTFGTRMNQLGNLMSVSWSANATDFTSPFINEFKYNVTTTFYDDIWDNLYQRTSNFSHIEKYQDGQNWDHHRAIAKIMKSFYFQYLVDLYGDLPYTQIHNSTDFLFPKYDDDKATYRLLITQLDDAINLIDNTDDTTVRSVVAFDVMMHGDMPKWKRFANTLKLRILLRQSQLADADTQTYLTQQFANLQNSGAQFLAANEDVTINPGYLNSDGKQNPFYATYGRDPQGDATSTNNLVGPSKFTADFLRGLLPGRSVVDPRRLRLYTSRTAGSTTITGVAQGASTGRPSRLGPAIIKGSNQDMIIMQSAESLFLQAEAAQRGYLAGNAQALFENGINASFAILGSTPTEAANYITLSQGVNTVGWTGSANKIEAIITQKWIANNCINGIESWIELTRTGFPSGMPLPLTTNSATRPIRLLYPASEYSGNTNNVPNQTAADAFTSPVFWDN
ncbi:SusD/RagB family nutrient-binding outer membrane lipoprotein [Flavobacterium humi]|uniref:SusD/RagB family nutrient-binding outer membrane lipoprotein n=2 Tax=Flavobacterium humi TaxID=2562683 RepID=A0A4Z0L9V6_9FLAO|nr:SusD/RagB family nutrient-binding outer membrane lipoprotein [Flavobacterium humi]